MKKIKGLMFTFIILMMIGFTNVKAADLNDILDTVVPEGKFSINAIQPKDGMEFDFYIMEFLGNFGEEYYDQNVFFTIRDCNTDFTTCDLVAIEQGAEDPIPLGEASREVTMVWHTSNPIVKKKVDAYSKQLTDLIVEGDEGWPIPYLIDLTDMSLINYYVSANTKDMNKVSLNKTISYSETLREMFGGANMSYSTDMRRGNTALFDTYGIGGFYFYYNNIIYGVVDEVGIKFIQAIYVPSDIELTDVALIAAANKRIKDYLPNSNITITVGELMSSTEYEYADFSSLVDLTKTTDKTYLINFGDFSVPFLIVTDSTKMTNPKFKTNDLDTNIGIMSDETSIPLDTVVNVNELDKDGAEYKKLLEQIGAQKMISYDLVLSSKTKKENITKLDSGKFLVSIPVPGDLDGKDLIVYYVNAKGEKEVHEVNIKDGYASFETNHFSIYNLTEKPSEPNPQTYDGTINYFIFGIISLIGLCGTGLCFKKKPVRIR